MTLQSGGDSKGGAVPFNGSGQDPNASQPPATPAAPQAQPVAGQGEPKPEPKPTDPVTREELSAFRQEQEALAAKLAQRFSDKQATVLNKRVEAATGEIKATVDALKKQGVAIPENLDINSLALNRALNTPSGEPSGAASGLEQPGAILSPETVWAQDLEATMGLKLEAGDPEVVAVKADGTPAEYKASYLKALNTKSQRVQSAQPPVPQQRRSPGVLPSGGGSNTVDIKRDPASLLTEGFKQSQ